MDAELTAFAEEVLEVVRAALVVHGDDAADIGREWSAGFGGWFIEVTPRRDGAAKVSIGCDKQLSLLSFGHTHLELWASKRGPSVIEQLSQYLPAIFSGDFEEAGTGNDRFARVHLPNGKSASGGSVHLPLPWSLRRCHRYASYS